MKAANTSHGTFYLYFAIKEDLFRALAVDVAEAMVGLARTLPDLTDGDDGRAALRAWLEGFADLYSRSGAVIRTWTEAEVVDTDFGRIGAELVNEFSRQLARRLEVAAPDVDPRLGAAALVAMIERSCYYLEPASCRSRGERWSLRSPRSPTRPSSGARVSSLTR